MHRHQAWSVAYCLRHCCGAHGVCAAPPTQVCYWWDSLSILLFRVVTKVTHHKSSEMCGCTCPCFPAVTQVGFLICILLIPHTSHPYIDDIIPSHVHLPTQGALKTCCLFVLERMQCLCQHSKQWLLSHLSAISCSYPCLSVSSSPFTLYSQSQCPS